MRIALVAEQTWLMREQQTFRRLAMGLFDRGAQAVLVVPEDSERPDEPLLMNCQQITYAPAGWRWLRDARLRGTAEALTNHEVDLIHVMSGSLQTVGLRLARAVGVPLICSVWSTEEAERLAPVTEEPPVAYSCASAHLAQRCRQAVGPDVAVHNIGPGVYRSSDDGPVPELDPERAITCAVVGNGLPDEHYRALLGGMAKARQRLGPSMFFFYSGNRDQHGIYQAAQRAGLLEQINLVLFRPDNRELLVQADVLIQPQPLGLVRSLLLEAMAAGRPVIAPTDPATADILNDRTARLLEANPTPGEWSDCLCDLVEDPGTYATIATAGREHVREHFSVSTFVGKTHGLYERVIAAPIPFSPDA